MSEPGTQERQPGRPWKTYVLLVTVVAVAPIVGLFYATVQVAKQVVQRNWNEAYLLVALSGVAGGVTPLVLSGFVSGMLNAVYMAVIVATMGMACGIGAVNGWSFRRVVAVSAVSFALTNLAAIGTMNEVMASQFDVMLQEYEEIDKSEYTQQQMNFIESINRFSKSIKLFTPGMALGGALVSSCIGASVVGWRLRASGLPIKSYGHFRSFSPPDATVWAVIATAALWFLTREMSNDLLTMFAWSAAISVAMLYALSGIAIFIYYVNALRPPWFFVFITAFFMLYAAWIVFPMVGLFDTWADFRKKIDNALVARNVGDDSHDDTAP